MVVAVGGSSSSRSSSSSSSVVVAVGGSSSMALHYIIYMINTRETLYTCVFIEALDFIREGYGHMPFID